MRSDYRSSLPNRMISCSTHYLEQLRKRSEAFSEWLSSVDQTLSDVEKDIRVHRTARALDRLATLREKIQEQRRGG